MAEDISGQAVWNRVFDPTANALRSGGTTANPPADTAEPFQVVLNLAFDDAADKLRMNA